MIAFDIFTKLCSEIQILRKQCVNILFQLGVFSDIQRKSYFSKTLIFRILSEQRNIMEYHFAILIIWRSLVQAQAGPQKNKELQKSQLLCFFRILKYPLTPPPFSSSSFPSVHTPMTDTQPSHLSNPRTN